jgi:histidinol phosphatase-like enzyme
MAGRKAVFLDLQGTLGGEGIGDIRNFSFFSFSADAIKLINDAGLLTIILTNQSHIADGYFTLEYFHERVNELKDELSIKGAYLDGVYCCPHRKKKIARVQNQNLDYFKMQYTILTLMLLIAISLGTQGYQI